MIVENQNVFFLFRGRDLSVDILFFTKNNHSSVFDSLGQFHELYFFYLIVVRINRYDCFVAE